MKMVTVEKNIVKFTAGEDLAEQEIVKLNADGEAVKVDSTEETKAVGIVYAEASKGDVVSVITAGLLDNVRVLVEDTSSESGYDASITPGDRLLISGKSDGTYDVGQALSSDQGDGATGGDGTVVAKAFEAVEGSESEDTYTTIKAYVNFIN